ncbi:MAG: 4Fe-4S dicluster domain-containing protein [Desulfobacterales bacterium]|jgi:flavodoxin/ferredoxin|nr:4Fe-4S dicluster domain-containing protein [Desulfobacteraceae bacterium]MBT4365150.1 4Fe-4S dicluster domain-containing protein [Desulfobacteraceae bacterium]MBT7085101.1 4Fe-4S dicluster domain-containing protein [Desulfobacterales bacterium]MBT7697742.1 4Fe-4S dicluster domain-containing protein [Desulfobacterales bacterium]
MKTLIICFSQTGNTRKVAEYIRDGIKDEIEFCEITDLAGVDMKQLDQYDLVGLGCPVFYYKEPENVRSFIEELPDLNDKNWFLFCTHGSVMGVIFYTMKESLEKKGIRVIGYHDTYADGTLPFYPHPTLTTGHPDDQDLQEAQAFGKKVAQCGRAVSDGDTSCIEKPAPVPEEWVPGEAEMITNDFLLQVMPPLSINSETCVQCGDCQDACPVNGIDIESDPPKIQDPCICCFHCINVCPTCSIETDWAGYESLAPENYARYLQALKDAEARGEFRWLMDPETINFNDPYYKQRKRKLENKKE